MTTKEAQWIVRHVRCHCDGRGVTPGPQGIAIKCPDCDGRFVSNEEYKAALEVLKVS